MIVMQRMGNVPGFSFALGKVVGGATRLYELQAREDER